MNEHFCVNYPFNVYFRSIFVAWKLNPQAGHCFRGRGKVLIYIYRNQRSLKRTSKRQLMDFSLVLLSFKSKLGIYVWRCFITTAIVKWTQLSFPSTLLWTHPMNLTWPTGRKRQ